jgi:hypothetical protein
LKQLLITPVLSTEMVLDQLEQKNLIRKFHCSKKALLAKEGEVVDDYVYTTDPRWGSHALLCVGFNKTTIQLASHPDNEEFLLFSDAGHTKPLYILIGLHKRNEFVELVELKKITDKDFILLKTIFNDPKLSIFTMLAGTPHAEVTVLGSGRPPCFFVTEPANLPMEPIDCNLEIRLKE